MVVNSNDRSKLRPSNPQKGKKYRTKPLPKYSGPSARFSGGRWNFCDGLHLDEECAGGGMYQGGPDTEWIQKANMAFDKGKEKRRRQRKR